MNDEIYFLKIADLPGDSKDRFHQGWIDVTDYSQGSSPAPEPQAVSPTGSKPKPLTYLRVTAVFGSHSARLDQAAVNGTPFKEATFQIVKNGQLHGVFTFKDFFVASIATTPGGEDKPVTQNITFVHREMEMKFGTTTLRTGGAQEQAPVKAR